ncbi:SulP family inorganic anion transporter [Sulfurovum riftiae]|uniref:Sulfate permease n=1 Tax=Sulfurovum riftiae TaxID=1630136 RepID=A0A151CHB8_9BACT|nr:SulP family inorganic anion transporter [Sulfurovum riftiae]KYJ86901.1 sulfate permease [Sulfurovum riftiae]
MINMKTLPGDLFGGITAAVVALPLALAFGVQSGMGAIAGLYGAIALGILAAIFGGTKTQISGPTGPMAVVAAAVIAGEIAIYGSVDAAIGTIVATFVLAGVFQILMGISGIGKYVRYMPYPVISGFMSGIGLIIIFLQIFPFFGLKSPSQIVDVFTSLGTIAGNINWQAVGLAVATIAIIYLFPRVTRKVPSALVALIGLTLVAVLMKLDVPVIGDIPKGFPDVHIDTLLSMDWHHPMTMVIPALTLAALGAIDSLLTSVVADNKTKTKHDSNRELIGQGVGNVGAGLIGGLPGAGATMRTVVNIDAGGRTRLSGVIHGLGLLAVLLGAGTYAAMIPLPVLAGILITVGVGIIDYKGLKHITDVPRSEAVIMVIVLILTVFVDLLQAVAVGMVLASILFMKKMGDVAEEKAQATPLDMEEGSVMEGQDKEHQIYVQTFDGPIFFGFTSYFSQIISELPNVKVVVLRMEKVPYIDQSGMYAIEDAVLELEKRGIEVFITGIQKQPEDMLRRIRLIPEVIEEESIFKDFETFKRFVNIAKSEND